MADDTTAFPTLDGGQLAALDALGTRRAMAAGEYLFREGDATYDFYVIVSGEGLVASFFKAVAVGVNARIN